MYWRSLHALITRTRTGRVVQRRVVYGSTAARRLDETPAPVILLLLLFCPKDGFRLPVGRTQPNGVEISTGGFFLKTTFRHFECEIVRACHYDIIIITILYGIMTGRFLNRLTRACSDNYENKLYPAHNTPDNVIVCSYWPGLFFFLRPVTVFYCARVRQSCTVNFLFTFDRTGFSRIFRPTSGCQCVRFYIHMRRTNIMIYIHYTLLCWWTRPTDGRLRNDFSNIRRRRPIHACIVNGAFQSVKRISARRPVRGVSSEMVFAESVVTAGPGLWADRGRIASLSETTPMWFWTGIRVVPVYGSWPDASG